MLEWNSKTATGAAEMTRRIARDRAGCNDRIDESKGLKELKKKKTRIEEINKSER